MKQKTVFIAAIGMAAAVSLPVCGQIDWDKKKYPDYSPKMKPNAGLAVRNNSVKRPDRVNNAETVYFPPVFNQDGGSCGSASRIAYMFNYEINAWRGLDGSLEENQYPTHFTWLLTNSNSGKDGMAIANGIPNVPTYGGRTYSRLFGNQDCSDSDFGWMNGYDKWYAAMHNRLERTANFPISVETEEGREAVKNWLWNHNGDTSFKAGGICGIGVASGGVWKNIPRTTTNSAIGVTGQYYVDSWGKQVDHALTIVGYDDRVEFDLDGNGIAGEKGKDEVGAWIIVNSWGAGWCNKGFIYCPYKNAVTTAASSSYYYPEVYYIRKDYKPLRTFKIKMDYSKRSEIKLTAGISENLNAEMPERTVDFEHFKYAGDGDGNGSDATTPMLGRWADGVHDEPMEFGYDLTDLSSSFNTRKPLKYFFIIESKSSASGTGKVHECSLIDYEFDAEGVEIPFDMSKEGVKIENKGKKTVISVIANGEPLHAPRNIVLGDGILSWAAPMSSSYALKAYNVYHNGTLLARVAADQLRYEIEPNGFNYSVSAVYDYEGADFESICSDAELPVTPGTVPELNFGRSFIESGFQILDIFSQKMEKVTIEYWIKPSKCIDWNQQIGPGWGSFLAHTTASGEFVVGWNTGSRITTAARTLRAGQWAHVAIVVDKNQMTAYINGKKAGEIASSYSGLGGFGTLDIGRSANNSGISGTMDELRIWNTARTQRQIQALMYAEIADPQNTPGLLAEIKMDESGSEKPVDATGRYQTALFSGNQSRSAQNSLFRDTRVLAADFAFPRTSYYTGEEVEPENTSSANSLRWIWTVDGSDVQYDTETPSFLFTTPGEKKIRLTAYDMEGNSVVAEKMLTVEALPQPVPAFSLSSSSVSMGERVSFINSTEPATGCTYEWSMPGAVTEKAKTVNATAVYTRPGEYSVTLKATNASGSQTVTHKVKVMKTAPVADFNVSTPIVLKGSAVTMQDLSKYDPDKWHWQVSDKAHVLVSNTMNNELVMDAPGVYDVSLDVSNESGESSVSKKRAVIVCNANSFTGLNFTGKASEVVSFKNPITEDQTGFTIDWWMYSKGNKVYSHKMGNSINDFVMRVDGEGALHVIMGKITYTTAPGFIVPSEWHHYAVVFDRGDLYIYKDCSLESAFNTPWTDKMPAVSEKMQMGGNGGAMNAIIDEFRIWNSALSKDDLMSYANAPIEEVAQAEEQRKLALYYQFNQSSGNVNDATSNGNTGTRSGFGPEGDAWGSSLGVFCLSTVERPDVTADYLTNYQMPFLMTDETVNPYDAERYRVLLQDSPQSAWKIENPTIFRDVITGIHVDTSLGQAMAITMKIDDFEGEVNNHKLYQTITLPAGHYAFGVEGLTDIATDEGYVVVAAGVGLPDTENLGKQALAYSELSKKEVVFTVSKPTEISVGLLLNARGEMTMAFRRFYLETLFSNDDFSWTGIASPGVGAEMSRPQIRINGRTVVISCGVPQRVAVYTPSGLPVYSGQVNGSVSVELAPGVYIVAGQKIVIR